MKSVALSMLLMMFLVSGLHASDSINDIYGSVTSIDITPVYGGGESGSKGRVLGYRRSITVLGNTYPLDSKLVVTRVENPPAMYPKVPAKLDHVTPGKYVNLRLSGHSVIEIVIQGR